MLGAVTHLGLAGMPLDELRSDILEAWDDFLDVVAGSDLSKPSRLKGMSARDVCVHLGTWDDHEVLPGLVAAARSGDRSAAVSPEELNRSLLARHADASQADVVEALHRSRREIADWLESGEAEEVGRSEVNAAIGLLP